MVRRMALDEQTVGSVSEFVSLLLADGGNELRWFRGQGCHSRTLTPSLVRRMDPFSAAELLRVERRLITRFRQRSLPFWPEGYPQQDWEHLFAMQHHGLPTRLLDWSENALMGLYFAVDHDPGRCECGTASCRPTVWVLRPIQLNRHNSRLDGYGDSVSVLATSDPAIEPWAPGTDETRFAPWPIAMYGTHNSRRIVAQQGAFTAAGKEGTPLEEAPAVAENGGVLQKIEVAADTDEIRRELRLLGVSRATVYPDLVGVAADIADEELT